MIDEAHYIRLCIKYEELIKINKKRIQCYSDHAFKLRERERKEYYEEKDEDIKIVKYGYDIYNQHKHILNVATS